MKSIGISFNELQVINSISDMIASINPKNFDNDILTALSAMKSDNDISYEKTSKNVYIRFSHSSMVVVICVISGHIVILDGIVK